MSRAAALWDHHALVHAAGARHRRTAVRRGLALPDRAAGPTGR